MKKKTGFKKILKKVLNIRYIILICILILAFSFLKMITSDHYYFDTELLSSYSLDSNVDLDVTVNRKSSYSSSYYYTNSNNLSDKLKEALTNDKVTLTVSLENEKGRTVRGTKEKVKTEFGDNNEISIELPDGLEEGRYTLKLKAKKGLFKDVSTTDLDFSKTKNNLITISMDKGIYKPGDDINFRALITDSNENKPTDTDVEVSIYDGNDNRVYFEERKTSEFGIISGVFSLSDEVNSGTYKLVVETENGEKEKVFNVDTYTEERFEVAITKKDAYKSDEEIVFDINSKYFFGEPVANAKVVITDIATNKDEVIRTNADGIATYYGEIKEEGEYSYTIEVTDTSNYYVSAQEKVVVSDKDLIIDIVPELGSLVKNVKNRIYVYVEDVKGNPIKAQAKLQYGNITREFRTDSKGMGYVDIGAADINNICTVAVSISTEEYGDVVEAKNFDVINKTNIVKTDKVLYEQGETVEIALGNYDEDTSKLYVVRNGELLQTLNITSGEQTLDLDKVYGLVDIYIEGKETVEVKASKYVDEYLYFNDNSTNVLDEATTYVDTDDVTSRLSLSDIRATDIYVPQNKTSKILNKKTIFIKPNMAFKISLDTNKEEYKPSEEMILNIANSDSKEAAYLVSIIDTANLNIADNDLTIDKIKLALEDIKFTDGVDAATVYAAIMSETDEGELEKLLTKQESKDFRVTHETLYTDFDEENVLRVMAIAGIVLFVSILILIIYFFVTEKNTPFVRFFIRSIPIVIILTWLITTFLYELLDDASEFTSFLLGFVIAVFAYNKKLKEYDEIIARNIWEVVITYSSWSGLLLLAYVLGAELFVIALVVLILLVYAKRNTKVCKAIINFVKMLIKTGCMFILTMFASTVIFEVLDISYRYEEFVFIVTMIILYYGLYRYRKQKGKFNKENIKSEEKTENKSSSSGLDIFHFIGIGVVVLLVLYTFVTSTTRNFSNNIDTIEPSDDLYYFSGSTQSSGSLDASLDVNQFSAKSDSSSSSSSSKFNFSSTIESITDNFKSESSTVESEDTFIEETEEIKTTLDDETEEKVRSVFLECLTFMPEVVAENGDTDVNVNLSDNITTWKVQVVGNTKDGDITYGTTEFRVFKEFFVDFTVPNNLKVGDRISIPATIYNYTDESLNVNLKVNEASWFKLNSASEIDVNLESKGTHLVYIDIEVLEVGDNKLRLEASANNLKDIIEKVVPVAHQGLTLSEISANGNTKDDVLGQVLFTEDYVEGSGEITVNIYPNLLSFAVEGMDSILRLPTGCFEQVSSSLYPDIMVLSYLEDSNDDENKELKQKAVEYINKGYQKLLTYEVDNQPGGFSLYGNPDAETVLTAYGLLELSDLAKVHTIDESVLERMESFLESKQKGNGSFEITGYHDSAVASNDTVSLNAYIIWALSEYNPDSRVVEKGVEYIKNKIDNVDDPYTLALMVNVLINTKDSEANEYLEKLLEEVEDIDGTMHVTSKCRDYLGVSSRIDVQATALTSMALTKANKNDKVNQELINYIINRRTSTTWGNTHTTAFALRAINAYNKTVKSKEQTLDVTVGGKTETINIKENGINFVSLNFDGISDEYVDYEISGIKANIYYEIVKKYNVEYDNVEPSYKFKVTRELYDHLNMQVNDVLSEVIIINNISNNTVDNAMVEIEIPQGFVVETSKLDAMVNSNRIEKYETSYEKIYVYLRDIEKVDEVMFEVEFRALYPVDVTGGAVRVYDYYNSEISEVLKPIDIVVK